MGRPAKVRLANKTPTMTGSALARYAERAVQPTPTKGANETSQAPHQIDRLPMPMLVFLLMVSLWDGFDVVALSQTLPELRKSFALSVSEGGQLVGLANSGTLLGYFLLRRADSVGRRSILLSSVLGYSLLSLASALAPSAALFLLTQFAARIFLVSALGAASLYISESLPARKVRSALSLLVATGAFGGVVCALLTPKLMGAGPGWRSVYLLGAVMLLTVPWGYLHLHETPSFARLTSRVTPSLTAMWTVQHRRNLLLCSFLWLLTYAANQSTITFWKEHAVADLSLSAAVAGTYLGLAALVAIPMSGFVGPLLNRVGKRRGALIVYGLWTLGILGSYLLPAGPLLRLALACLTSGASGGLIIATAFTTELFPTAQRGDAMAWSNSLLGRIGFIASPPLMSMLADAQGWTNTMPYLAVLPLSALVVVWLVPSRRHTPRDDNAPEWSGD